MQLDPRYEDVVGEVREFLRERMEHAVASGVARERIMLDPGIGFGKTEAHNLELLRRLAELSRPRCAAARGDLAQGLPRQHPRPGGRAR